MNKYDLEKLFRYYRRSFLKAKGEPLFLVVPSMTGLPTRTTVDKIRWVRGICFDPALPPTWPELKAKTIEIFGSGLPASFTSAMGQGLCPGRMLRFKVSASQPPPWSATHTTW